MLALGIYLLHDTLQQMPEELAEVSVDKVIISCDSESLCIQTGCAEPCNLKRKGDDMKARE